MDHQSCSAIAEHGMRAGDKTHVFVDDHKLGLAFLVDGEIVHVARVRAVGILQAVLLAVGVEVRAGGLEIGRVALCILVDMDSVLPWGKLLEIELDLDAFGCRFEGGCSDALAFGIF